MPFPSSRLKKKIGELLIESGLVTLDDIRKVLEYQKANGGLIGEILVNLGIVKESDIAYALAKQFNLPYIDCRQYAVPDSVKGLVSADVMRREGFVLLDKIGKVCVIAFALLPRKEALEPLGNPDDFSVFISEPSSVLKTIEKHYQTA